MGYEALVGFNYWSLIAQICNLLLQVYLFKRFLFQPVKKILVKRQEEVDALQQSANEANEKAQLAQNSYETQLSQAREEAASLVKSATAAAQQRGDEIVRQAKAEAASIKEKASADIAQEKKKVLNEIKNDISGIAMEIAAKVVEKEIDDQDQQALIEQFIGKLGEEA